MFDIDATLQKPGRKELNLGHVRSLGFHNVDNFYISLTQGGGNSFVNDNGSVNGALWSQHLGDNPVIPASRPDLPGWNMVMPFNDPANHRKVLWRRTSTSYRRYRKFFWVSVMITRARVTVRYSDFRVGGVTEYFSCSGLLRTHCRPPRGKAGPTRSVDAVSEPGAAFTTRLYFSSSRAPAAAFRREREGKHTPNRQRAKYT